MKRTLFKAVALASALALGTIGVALASYSQDVIYEQDFSSDTGDWNNGGGAYGSVTHNDADETATIEGAAGDFPTAPYSFFGTIDDRTVWPKHGYITQLDVYLDPGEMDNGDGFDLSVASYREDPDSQTPSNPHLRDFIIHVGKVDDALLVNGSNNSDWQFNALKLTNQAQDPAEITDAGWYTLRHSFYDLDGSLAVDLDVLDDAGAEVFSATRNNTNDLIDGVVGGVGYMWFVYASAAFDIDNQLLAYNVLLPDAPTSRSDCMRGGFADFGFDNQGQCVASVQANERAGQ